MFPGEGGVVSSSFVGTFLVVGGVVSSSYAQEEWRSIVTLGEAGNIVEESIWNIVVCCCGGMGEHCCVQECCYKQSKVVWGMTLQEE